MARSTQPPVRDRPRRPGTPGAHADPGVPGRAADVEAALRRLGVRPARSAGQSFLVDRFVADALAALAEPASGAPVVEVGGGLGLVTRALLDRGVADLTVVERDRRLALHLARTFGDSITVVPADARGFEFPPHATVVGSLPFSSGTLIVLELLRRRLPRFAVLLQKEVAERFAAGAGSRDYGRPSILAHLYGTPELHREVPSAAFYPAPRVRGRLLTFVARRGPLPVASVDRLERTVRRLFTSRRKQLGNLLPAAVGGDASAVAVASAADWPDDWGLRRPEALAPEAYFRLANVLERRDRTA